MKPPFNYTSTPLPTCDDWSQVSVVCGRKNDGLNLGAAIRIRDVVGPAVYEEIWAKIEVAAPGSRTAAMREDFV